MAVIWYTSDANLGVKKSLGEHAPRPPSEGMLYVNFAVPKKVPPPTKNPVGTLFINRAKLRQDNQEAQSGHWQ